MESDKFDNVIRGAFEGASRRSVVRVGVGALAAFALATMGLRADDADAKKGKKKKKKKPVTPVATCAGTRPVTCGTGCCPSNFSLCCDSAREATNSFSCNPSSSVCCPIEQGGDACAPPFTKCCPATTQAPFGSCARPADTCCPSGLFPESCGGNFSKCCPGNPAATFDFGDCCAATEQCCLVTTDCPAGQVCNGHCCQ